MAKIVKKTRKRRKLNLKNITVLVLFVAVVLSLASSLFLRSYNNSLSVNVQRIDVQIAKLVEENEEYQIQIQTLSSRDRVTSIAASGGLEMNQDNITTITTAMAGQ